MSGAPFPARGPHAYCGEFPSSPPALADVKLQAAGFGDTSGRIVIDPRSLALDSKTKITRVNFDYEMTDSLSLGYQFGYVDHDAHGSGTAEGRHDRFVGPTREPVLPLTSISDF